MFGHLTGRGVCHDCLSTKRVSTLVKKAIPFISSKSLNLGHIVWSAFTAMLCSSLLQILCCAGVYTLQSYVGLSRENSYIMVDDVFCVS